jgi:hypothetical protein
VPAEQVIFTSLVRRGKSGYHVVARSPGVTESESAAVARWSPSHGGLRLDRANRVSANFLPLPTGRFAVSRTIEGPPEYSGRGGRQLYTHALIVDAAKLGRAGFRVFAVYRDALALGHFRYRDEPGTVLAPVELSELYPHTGEEAFAGLARDLGLATIEAAVNRLEAGQPVVIPFAGDRVLLAEYLLGRLDSAMVAATSVATSLVPSAARPYRLSLVAAD